LASCASTQRELGNRLGLRGERNCQAKSRARRHGNDGVVKCEAITDMRGRSRRNLHEISRTGEARRRAHELVEPEAA
jgi:hypothetical protein